MTKKIDELIDIAKAATPGPWVYDDGNRTVETTDKSPAHRKAICSTNDLFDFSREDEIRPYGDTWNDSEYIASFNPTLVLKLLESWMQMRKTLEDMSIPTVALGAYDAMLSERYTLCAKNAIAESNKVFE